MANEERDAEAIEAMMVAADLEFDPDIAYDDHLWSKPSKPPEPEHDDFDPPEFET